MKLTTYLSILISAATIFAGAAAAQAPAPTVDRVGFPLNYSKTMGLMYVVDRWDNKQVRSVYGNAAALRVKFSAKHDYEYGSVMVLETIAALKDADGNAILDANGRFQKDPAATATVNVMRKEKGFGADYKDNRNGEWEYVGYRPDGTYATMPSASANCAICHLKTGAGTDWTYGTAPYYVRNGSGAVPDGMMKNYKFVPGVITVKAGQFVTFYNEDGSDHTITDDTPGGGDTGLMHTGNSVSVQFTVPGEFNFHCSLHAGMKGKIIVTP